MKDIILAFIASGAFFSFIQFLISRFDTKNALSKKIDQLTNSFEEYKATLARTHILRFADDLRNGVHHSEEYFKQQLQDCDTYDRYCSDHPNFCNGLTIIASEYIKETFEKLYKEKKL